MTKQDWHPADIIAALHKRGTSLAALSRGAGLASSTLANALSRPWPKGEWLIATALKVHPATIWPTRYSGQEEYRLPKQPLPGVKIVAPRPCFPVPENVNALFPESFFHLQAGHSHRATKRSCLCIPKSRMYHCNPL